VLFLNQIRMKIGVMFGSPETTPGGQALRFFSSIRLDVRRTGKIMRGDEQVRGFGMVWHWCGAAGRAL
jgi:recombination protein RecA